jgi:hypothetical protein
MKELMVRERILLSLVTSSKYACCWHLFLMLENMMQLLKQFGAYLMKTERRTTELSKTDSLSRFVKSIPSRDQSLEANVFNLDITNMESQYGSRWPEMTRIASRATIVAKTAIMQVTAGQSRMPKAKQALPKGSPRRAKAVHPSHQRRAA